MNRDNLNGWAVYRNEKFDQWAYWRTDHMQPDDGVISWAGVEFESVWPTFEGAAQRARDLTAMVDV